MVDINLEVHLIPVHDPDRAKEFYQRLGWRFDSDDSPAEGVRIIQLTPPGANACSIIFGTGLTPAAPGNFQGGLAVTDIEAAHKEFTSRGVAVGDIFHGAAMPPEARQPGPHPERASYSSFFGFEDSEGNAWLVQEITTRHPGRV
jgi:predicted enzyme related to lactoylglutathione lyase